ncbi:hypothetical protein SE17_20180 [Kouleothrix aurantiaca]|uniref:Uncharacterized protein n=1 Tax=Kouleothrix aurantiaca TaxID=186479 RepID=A0A0P9F552_9CHLR|nr:hypothetical protein SE17_20180 [Kouleothrix aurantiaca]
MSTTSSCSFPGPPCVLWPALHNPFVSRRVNDDRRFARLIVLRANTYDSRLERFSRSLAPRCAHTLNDAFSQHI